ncbi:hypothetical protein K488DRAFT_87913 [Vararia minispora EC-137]|uniref:Uncharacterized protein n=1 Tax=Vararia minispora EC-137 TaxID=1314806 RepID=A0ACB8QF06_9AGAM|nr:hypothetical protein K488DRAFT_87913 [Vararia minispora EC-137]
MADASPTAAVLDENATLRLYDYIRQSIPLFILETYFLGLFLTASLLYCYITLSKGVRRRPSRITKLVAIASMATIVIVHWALGLEQSNAALWECTAQLWLAGYSLMPLFMLPVYGGLQLETAAFGSFCALFAVAVSVFIKRGLQQRRSVLMFLLIILMFLLSAAHWAFQVAFVSSNWLVREEAVLQPGAVPIALETVNVLLSDAIVLWRMCVLWRNDVAILVLAGVLWLVNIGVSIANVISEYYWQTHPMQYMLQVQPIYTDTVLGSVALALSLASNLAATSLISWKAWRHRQLIRRHLSSGAKRTRVERVMSLLIESGTLYCVIWILYTINSRSSAMNINHKLADASQTPNGQPFVVTFYGTEYFNRFMAQLTGIYPTIIIVLVALQKTHCEHQFTYRDNGSMTEPVVNGTASRAIPLEVHVSRQAFSVGRDVEWPQDSEVSSEEEKKNKDERTDSAIDLRSSRCTAAMV